MLSTRAVRNIAYLFEIIICFALQGSIHIIPEIAGARPVLLLCCVSTIALFEKKEYTLVLALIIGLITDISAGSAAGPGAICLVLICFAISAIFESVLHVNLLSGVLAGAICVFCTESVLYFSLYIMNGYGAPGVFANKYLPGIVYTCLLLPAFYFINKALSGNMNKSVK